MDTVSSAIGLTCNIAFDGEHTPSECFLRAVTILLCYAPDKDWKLEEEMQGWCVGEDRLARLSAVRGSVGRAMNSEKKSVTVPRVMALFLNETFSPGLPDSNPRFRLHLLVCVVSNWIHRREGPSADPGGAKGRGSKRMFWELAAGGVFEKDVDLQSPKTRRARNEYNRRTSHLREYTLKEFWEISVDDSPFGADAILGQVNVHSKAVFSL